MSIPCVHVYNMSPFQYHDPEILNTEIQKKKITQTPENFFLQKCSFQTCRNTNFINALIQIIKIPRYKFQKYRITKYRNTNYRNTEIPISEIQKY